MRWWSAALIIATLMVAIVAIPGLRQRAQRLLHGGDMARRTVAERLAEFGGAAEARLAPRFAAARVPWPPRRATLAAFKDSRQLELHAPDGDGVLRFVHAYPILAASGGPGPKLREGDHQVPEGIYAITALNPNSAYHVSLRLDYPNADDRTQGTREGRDRLGGDIMIHGKAQSVGCLAMGDPAAEELFLLATRCGVEQIRVLIAPTDLRRFPAPPVAAAWIGERYAALATELAALPMPP